MKKWQYAKAVYLRNHKSSEPAIDCSATEMSDIKLSECLYVDGFLKVAGERGWELTTTLLPFPAGKELADHSDEKADMTTYRVQDPLDIQWLIFKREL